MENAGLVTFNDAFVWREEVDSSETTWIATVNTHELSHHVFINNKYIYIIIDFFIFIFFFIIIKFKFLLIVLL